MTPWIKISKSKLYIGQYDTTLFLSLWSYGLSNKEEISYTLNIRKSNKYQSHQTNYFLKSFLKSCMKHDDIFTTITNKAYKVNNVNEYK